MLQVKIQIQINKHAKSLRIRTIWWERLVALVKRDWRGCSGGPWTRPTLHWRHENIPSLVLNIRDFYIFYLFYNIFLYALEICVCLLWTRPTMEKTKIFSCLATFIFYIFHLYFINMELTCPILNWSQNIPICWSGPALLCLWSHKHICKILCLFMWSVKTKNTPVGTHNTHIFSTKSTLILILRFRSLSRSGPASLPMEAKQRQPFHLLRLGHRPWWKTFARLISWTWLLGKKDFKNVPWSDTWRDAHIPYVLCCEITCLSH